MSDGSIDCQHVGGSVLEFTGPYYVLTHRNFKCVFGGIPTEHVVGNKIIVEDGNVVVCPEIISFVSRCNGQVSYFGIAKKQIILITKGSGAVLWESVIGAG